jgi:ADP-ribose pyrophosphatase
LKLGSRRIHSGRVLNLDIDSVRFPDGSVGEVEMIRHSGASAVVPVLSVDTAADPEILLIRQFRHAADGPIWEIPAGRLDPGESPETCAVRELAEETGMRAGRIERLTTMFTTPGFTDERIHIFAAHDLEPGPHRREADEFLEIHALRLSRCLELVRSGEISDGKTALALLFFSQLGPQV